jgi:hypothetical protein
MAMAAATAAFTWDFEWAGPAFRIRLRTEPIVNRPVVRLIRLRAAARIRLIPAGIWLSHRHP